MVWGLSSNFDLLARIKVGQVFIMNTVYSEFLFLIRIFFSLTAKDDSDLAGLFSDDESLLLPTTGKDQNTSNQNPASSTKPPLSGKSQENINSVAKETKGKLTFEKCFMCFNFIYTLSQKFVASL